MGYKRKYHKKDFYYSCRNDGWDNIYDEMITFKDKINNHKTAIKYNLSQVILDLIYRLDGFAKKIVDKPVDLALSKGFTIENEKGEELQKVWKKLKINSILKKFLKLGRLYGGAMMHFSVEGSGQLEEPLNIKKSKAINFIRVNDRYEVSVDPSDIETDPDNDNFLKPKFYTVTPRLCGISTIKNYKVHYTKCIIDNGAFTPPRCVNELHQGVWGDSSLQCLIDALENLKQSYLSSNKMLKSAIQTIMQIKNLQQMLMRGKNSGIKERLQAIQDGIDIDNIILMDFDEKFQKVSANFSGSKDIIEQNAIALASQADFPVTLLLGRSPAGENATGEYDKKNEISFIQSYQKDKIYNALNTINNLIFSCSSYNVNTINNEDPEFKWNPVETILTKEFSEIYKNTSEGDENYFNINGALTRQELRDNRWKKGEFSIETKLNSEYDNKELPNEEDILNGGKNANI